MPRLSSQSSGVRTFRRSDHGGSDQRMWPVAISSRRPTTPPWSRMRANRAAAFGSASSRSRLSRDGSASAAVTSATMDSLSGRGPVGSPMLRLSVARKWMDRCTRSRRANGPNPTGIGTAASVQAGSSSAQPPGDDAPLVSMNARPHRESSSAPLRSCPGSTSGAWAASSAALGRGPSQTASWRSWARNVLSDATASWMANGFARRSASVPMSLRHCPPRYVLTSILRCSRASKSSGLSPRRWAESDGGMGPGYQQLPLSNGLSPKSAIKSASPARASLGPWSEERRTRWVQRGRHGEPQVSQRCGSPKYPSRLISLGPGETAPPVDTHRGASLHFIGVRLQRCPRKAGAGGNHGWERNGAGRHHRCSLPTPGGHAGSPRSRRCRGERTRCPHCLLVGCPPRPDGAPGLEPVRRRLQDQEPDRGVAPQRGTFPRPAGAFFRRGRRRGP